MFTPDRYEAIMTILKQEKRVTVKMLAKTLDISVDTVRRDLKYLEDAKKLTRVHGGAILLEEESEPLVTNVSFQKRIETRQRQKQGIAKKAMDYVKENQAIALNAGTTNIEVAKELVKHFDALTIITNSLPVINIVEKKPNFTVVVTGHFLDHDEYSFYDEQGNDFSKHFHCDIVFISINAISLKQGLTDFRQKEKETILSYMDAADRKIVVADASKFETSAFLRVCDFDQIDAIVTDASLPKEIAIAYQKQNIVIE